MLRDWLSSFLIVSIVCFEIAGWACFFSFKRLPYFLTYAASVAITAHFYFALSLLGITQPVVHFGLGILGFVFFLFFFSRQKHLPIVRIFSVMSWRKNAVWLVLPLFWIFLKIVDGMVPQSDASLSGNLLAARWWYEDGIQKADPLNPMMSMSSIWDGIYFHIQALSHFLTLTLRTSLVRAQIASQLAHFLLGQVLCILIVAELLMKRTALMRIERHRNFTLAVALCISWIAMGRTTGTYAGHTWAAVLFSWSSLGFMYFQKPLLGFFAWGTAVATNPTFAVLIAPLLWVWIKTNAPRPKAIFTFVLGSVSGIALFVYRNWSLTGALFFPFGSQNSYGPQWFTQAPSFDSGLEIFLISAVLVLVLWATYFVAERVLVASFGHLKFLRVGFWIVAGLILVRLPIHVLWHNLGFAFQASDVYLSKYHPHFSTKLWAGVHLPQNARILWTSDPQFYYLTQKASVSSKTKLIYDSLMRSDSPVERVQRLCELGFNYFAWVDRAHGPEVAGLEMWLKLKPNALVHKTSEVSLFRLDTSCLKP